MKKILIAAGIVGTAAAGVFFYMRNRNKTAKAMHKFADAAGDVHDGVRRYFRRAHKEARRDMEDAIA
ncbi:hypothetical protein GWC95_13305 [Sediminibacterium roseum]|uniref:YtxH-like protein n=1 Tax=Sediminibacterium roseum TaxID=1978412 RepID=A0ABW9ZUT9_9BACT|nr:hypothetical protein [Sediminibacterium roseum]NCI50905.1 hypothetical protein [Sediminibacterium roseum]